MSTKLLRIRFPDGKTQRITVPPSSSLSSITSSILSLNKVGAPLSFYADPRHQVKVNPLSAQHGDLIYVKGIPVVEIDEKEKKCEKSEGKKNYSGGKNGGGKGKAEVEWGLRCLHGPRGMCARCAPKETAEERLQKAEAGWAGGRGSSVSVMEARAAMTPTIKVERGGTMRVKVSGGAAFGFQDYLVKTGFGQQRLGVLYGSSKHVQEAELDEDVERETEVEAVYEPKQWGDADTYRAIGFGGETSPEEVGENGNVDMNENGIAREQVVDEERLKVNKLNNLLGLSEVGLVISARPRKCLLSGKDVVVAAEEAVRVGDKKFVILLMSLAEDGKTMFEAYHLSEQALELHRKGFFASAEEQKANKGRVLMKKEVLVEGRETRKVHTEFFLVNVPIQSIEGKFRTKFPVENRELDPQNAQAVKDMTKEDSGMPYWKRVADWHLLLFLGTVLDMNTDMPAFVKPILEGRDFAPEEEGFKLMIDAIGSAA